MAACSPSAPIPRRARSAGITAAIFGPAFLGYFVMLGAALLVAVAMGPLLERGVLRLFYRRDEVVIVLVTYALFLILEDATKLIWGVDPYYAY